ncbi:DUF2935 domain-containing protein [Paenibacillus xylaniclasticus]|uniref:DUF2935 domain-containing protein n=1 Tax=Paenibacillus xylaniclasticus TaxID=588083 RepID=UPI000FD7E652|nr:DUF2935 domain-containing protein [Paenibacillus xylaniclasticus]
MTSTSAALPVHGAEEAWFEHRFWLQILGDHARFIYHALSPKEHQDIRQAYLWMITFDQLLYAARTRSTGMNELIHQAFQAAAQLRSFKLSLLERQLTGRLVFELPPTFINHMVNELDKYLRILNALHIGHAVPRYDPLHYDLVWLPDAAGHAGTFVMDFDRVEQRLIHRSAKFEKHFKALYLKAVEMVGYMRTNLKDFPAYRRFHREIDYEMQLFIKFLKEIEELQLTSETLDIISPLMPDHMAREECYYLTKLAADGLVPHPNCDPARPRIND